MNFLSIDTIIIINSIERDKEMKCPNCGNTLPEDVKFCSACGKEMNDDKKICPQCHSEELKDALYCSKCGYDFSKQVEEKKEVLSRTKLHQKKKNKKKKIYIIIAVCVSLLLVATASYFLFFKDNKNKKEPTKTTELKETEKLILKENKFEIEVGKQDYIETNMDCTYKVKDINTVEVDSFETITAKSVGKTTITVNGENGKTALCTVTVKEGQQKIEIDNYQASSTLVASGYNYETKNLYDNNNSTCWCEGIDGDGIGETITVSFTDNVNVDTILLMNGFTKTQDLYNKNNRLKKITLTFDDGSVEDIELKDVYGEKQSISFNKHKTKNIVIKINEIYQGTTYQDTCITELTFSYQNE